MLRCCRQTGVNSLLCRSPLVSSYKENSPISAKANTMTQEQPVPSSLPSTQSPALSETTLEPESRVRMADDVKDSSREEGVTVEPIDMGSEAEDVAHEHDEGSENQEQSEDENDGMSVFGML
jgi:hypothetical protein